MPIGPVNVAVIDAAYRHTFRRAIAVGLGGACADCLYSGLGACGVTPFLHDYPSVDACPLRDQRLRCCSSTAS